MSGRRATAIPALAALLCGSVLATSATARAESGNINVHLELGAALPAAELGSVAGRRFSETSGFHLAVKGDYKVHSIISPQVTYIMNIHSRDHRESYYLGGMIGAKIRFLDDHEGPLYYAGKGKGMKKGNVWGTGWADVNVGYAYKSGAHTVITELAAGYEFSLLDYLQLGPFIAFNVLIPIQSGNDGLFTVQLGASFSIGFPPDVSTKEDRDGDGLPDSVEDANGNGVVDDDETDPEVADTDEDGISDGDERKYKTDPLDPDSDGDGAFDGEEVKAKTDPLDPGSVPEFVDEEESATRTGDGTGSTDRLERGIAVTGIEFDIVDAVLPGSGSALDGIADTIKSRTDIALLEVGVHLDPGAAGDPETLRLRSKSRADSVIADLVKRGVPATMLVAKGYGGDEPLDPTNPAINERVVVKKLK